MRLLNENIKRIKSLMEIVDEVELDESEVNEEGEESTDTTTDTSTDTSSDTGSSITPWESGVARGPANQVGNTKWSDIVKTTRGKANPIDTKSKWDSGVKRGKGNTLI